MILHKRAYSALPLFIILTSNLLSTTEAITDPLVRDDALSVINITSGITNTSELLSIGSDILLIDHNDDKVRVILDNVLKKYPVVDVNPGGSNEGGLVGIAKGPNGNGSQIILGYVSSNNDLDSVHFTKVIYSYYWNETGLQLDNPKRIIEIPIENSSRYDTGTIIGAEHEVAYLVVDNISMVQYRNSSYVENNCHNRLMRIHIANNSSTVYNVVPNKDYEFISCFKGRLYSLAYEDSPKRLWGIQSFSDGRHEITLVNVETNKTGISETCSSTLIPPINESCSNIQERKDMPTSLAFINSKSLGQDYLNHLFVAYANGSIYDVAMDSNQVGAKSRMNETDLWASNFGHISQIQLGVRGLYVLATQQNSSSTWNDTNTNLYLITQQIEAFTRADLVERYDNLSLMATGAIVSTIVSYLVFYRWRKTRVKKTKNR